MLLRIQNLRIIYILTVFLIILIIFTIRDNESRPAPKVEDFMNPQQFEQLDFHRKLELFKRTGARLHNTMIDATFNCLSINFRQALKDIETKSFSTVYGTLDELINVIYFELLILIYQNFSLAERR